MGTERLLPELEIRKAAFDSLDVCSIDESAFAEATFLLRAFFVENMAVERVVTRNLACSRRFEALG